MQEALPPHSAKRCSRGNGPQPSYKLVGLKGRWLKNRRQQKMQYQPRQRGKEFRLGFDKPENRSWSEPTLSVSKAFFRALGWTCHHPLQGNPLYVIPTNRVGSAGQSAGALYVITWKKLQNTLKITKCYRKTKQSSCKMPWQQKICCF